MDDSILSKESDEYETIKIESQVRQGFFHQVVKDLKSGQAVSCSCKCWTKGNKPCFGMRTVGYQKEWQVPLVLPGPFEWS